MSADLPSLRAFREAYVAMEKAKRNQRIASSGPMKGQLDAADAVRKAQGALVRADEECAREHLVLRPSVLRFAELMELKLRANDHKGGWSEDEAHALLQRASEELAEVDEAVSQEALAYVTGKSTPEMRRKVADECADVALHLLGVVAACNALPESPSEMHAVR